MSEAPAPGDQLARWFSSATGWPDAVLPAYVGGSVANVAPSILQAFHVPLDIGSVAFLPPLDPSVLDPALISGARVIVLIAIDGYGMRQRRASRGFLGQVGAEAFVERHITSVFPSTTAAALTSLQTGAAPARHGMTGYTLFLSEIGRVVNMVRFAPVDGGSFDRRKLDVASFLPVPTIYETLARYGIESSVVSHQEYASSPLTIVHSGDTPYAGHRSLGEFAGMLLREIERPGRRFVFGYWAGVDALAHTWGPSSFECAAEADLVELALRDYVLQPLVRSGDDVAVIVTADHGQIGIQKDRGVTLNDLRSAVGGWSASPTGERRAVGLSLADHAGRDRLSGMVGDDGVVLDVVDAIGAGLFGPEPHHPSLRQRIGEILLLARGQASFPFIPSRGRDERVLGGHGSLTIDEMVAPLLVWRFRA